MKYNWTIEELHDLYNTSLMVLLSRSNATHSTYHKVGEIQVCSLISLKTGGCPEDCKYCAQSSRYQTPVTAQPLMRYEDVMSEAKKALSRGATRICLAAAWRGIRDNKQFEEVLRIIKAVAEMGVEVCCTLGMLKEHQAEKLKQAGLYAYNHNLDTSERFYPSIITTRTYQDRIQTLDTVEAKGLSVCCGGILGLGESISDRLDLILTLCSRNPHPDSVPINLLSPIKGTPLESQPKVSIWEMLKVIAIARLTMPKAMIRIASGRNTMTYEEQALCFFAGANSIFMGEKLLTIANSPVDKDETMFELLGLKKRMVNETAR